MFNGTIAELPGLSSGPSPRLALGYVRLKESQEDADSLFSQVLADQEYLPTLEPSVDCAEVLYAAPDDASPENLPAVVETREGKKRRVLDGLGHPLPGFFLMRLGNIRELLQPKHEWFSGSEGFLEDFAQYSDGEKHFCYPRTVFPGDRKRNPFRQSELRSKHASRSTKRLMALSSKRCLADLRFATIELTFPKKISEWLASQSSGKDTKLAWALWERFWGEDVPAVIGADDLAAFVNLHKWKTDEPLLPHYHFHGTIPNYRWRELPDELDKLGVGPGEFEKIGWYSLPGRGEVPFTKEMLIELKKLWHRRLVSFARKHKLSRFVPRSWEKIDLHVGYIKCEEGAGMGKLQNRLKYQSRHWSEDYAKYSNEHLDCGDPPPWLAAYSNATRVYGWWKQLTRLAGTVRQNDNVKLSPLSALPMERERRVSLAEIEKLGGEVGCLEFIKGRPFFGVVNSADLAMLRSMVWQDPNSYPFGGAYVEASRKGFA